ncbi:MAG TPA: hypothetical protein VMU48_14180 [Terracidiphilus sp.]|nr:hypothetical protein [Terracidiphilus sp.]
MTAALDLAFPHCWQAEILAARPLILPTRHYVYPRVAEEVERGALEVLVRPHPSGTSHQTQPKNSPSANEFLATCALGFRDSSVPTGIWSCPNARELCAVSGGYAYLIDTSAPECFTMLPYRPVLDVRSFPANGLLLFVGHHAMLAWGARGLAWQSEKLSDEGITIKAIESGQLHGLAWQMLTDKEVPFTLDLRTGQKILS